MGKPIFTASQVDRLMVCHGSASLPAVITEAPAADAGTEDHARLLVADHCPPMLAEWLNPTGKQALPFMFERSYAWAPLTVGSAGEAHFLGSFLNRDYGSVYDGSIVGTADAAYMWRDDTGFHLRIADLKTGHQQVYGSSLPPAGESWQLRTLAVLIYLTRITYNLHHTTNDEMDVKVCFYYRRDDGGDATVERIDEATFSRDDLLRFAVQLTDLAKRVQNEPGREFKRGGHCTYCPAFEHCPAQREALFRLRLRPNCDLEEALSSPALSTAWQDLKAAKRIVELAEATLLTAAQRNGGTLPLGDGKEITTCHKTMTRIDAGKAKNALTLIDPKLSHLADLITKRTVTKESIHAGIERFLDGWRESHDVPEELSARLSVDALVDLFLEAGAATTTQSAPFLAERRTKNT